MANKPQMPAELGARYTQCFSCNHHRFDEISKQIDAFSEFERRKDFHGCHREVASMLDQFDPALANDYRAWHSTFESLSNEEMSVSAEEEKLKPMDNSIARLFIDGMLKSQGREIFTNHDFKEVLELLVDMGDERDADFVREMLQWYDADPINARDVIDSVLKEPAYG